MKTILWATLSANGNYAQSSAENPPKPEALRDFEEHVGRIGNFIVGRKTFENFTAGGAGPSIQSADIVVVSRQAVRVPGVDWAATPRAALEQLEQNGHATALLSGGESLHNAFLAENLVDEIVFNIAPVLEGDGLSVRLPGHSFRNVSLLGMRELGGGVVQLRYGLHS